MAKLVQKDTRQLHCLCKIVKQLLFDQRYCESMLCSKTYIFIKYLNVFNVNLYLFNLNVWEVILIIMCTLLLEGNLM